MIKQEIILGRSLNKCIKLAKPVIDKYSEDGYELTDTSFHTGFIKCKYILTFTKK